MKTLSFAIIAVIGLQTFIAPAFALDSRSGMPREPRTVRGICAKASQGNHIPYRGWSTRNRLDFNRCLRAATEAA